MRLNRKTTLKTLTAALVSAASIIPSMAAAAVIGDSLQDRLAVADAADTLEVIVAFEGDDCFAVKNKFWAGAEAHNERIVYNDGRIVLGHWMLEDKRVKTASALIDHRQ